MGLLDGDLAALFSQTLSPFYLDATLHRSTITQDGQGGGTRTTVNEAVKAQLEAATEAMRQAQGFTAVDVRILVLAQGVERPTTDNQITVAGVRYAILPPVGRDPAGAYWDLHGRPVA